MIKVRVDCDGIHKKTVNDSINQINDQVKAASPKNAATLGGWLRLKEQL
jgi:hypothetical protein